ncbi:MAG: hypothetical protein QI223_00870 [Candidatus Korarchaeota archaeon]|nr:hypothetical protein [Candidatus Korarchaeota archaeon]
MNPFERELGEMLWGLWEAVRDGLLRASALAREAAPPIALLLVLSWLLEDHLELAREIRRVMLYLLVADIALASAPRILGAP